jgi:hypothetical protein
MPASSGIFSGGKSLCGSTPNRFGQNLSVKLIYKARQRMKEEGFDMTRLEELIRELPPELHQEAEDFISFLIEKRARKPKGNLKLDWIGALQDMGDQYSSVEFQHKIHDWRDEEDDVPS